MEKSKTMMFGESFNEMKSSRQRSHSLSIDSVLSQIHASAENLAEANSLEFTGELADISSLKYRRLRDDLYIVKRVGLVVKTTV
jgi:hypothetical protein